MIQLLIFSAAKAALVLGLAALLAGLMRRMRPATRHLVWLAGLTGAFLVLPFGFLLPELHLGLVESRSAGTALNLLVLLGLVGAAAFLVRLAIDHVALNRLAGRTESVSDERLTDMVKAAAAELGVNRPVRLRRWQGPTPAMFGTFRPTILLPAAADGWAPERIRLVLLHELAHVARSDAASLVLGRCVAALHWFNPLAWWSLRRMRLECEQACDELVLGTGADPVAYARTLLETLQDGRAPPAPAGALAMTIAEHLETRLARILASPPDRPRRSGRKWAAWSAALALVAAALLLAPLRIESGGYTAYPAAVTG